MRKALGLILTIGLLGAGCGDDGGVLTAPDGTSSSTTAGPTTTEAAATTATTVPATTEPSVPDPEPGTLASLLPGPVEDPLMGSGWHEMAWMDDTRTVLVSNRSTTGTEGRDLLALMAYDPEPAVSGLAPDRVLVEAGFSFPVSDVFPTAMVVYAPGAGGWEAVVVVDDASVEAALLETTDYAAAAPDGPVALTVRPTALDGGASTLTAMVTVEDVGSGFETAYEGEILCDLSAEPLTCVTLTDDGVLRPGDAGEDVEALQEDLAALGYLTGAVDGRYGPGTEAAVRRFQRDYRLTVDGKAGPNTRELMADVAAGTSDLLLASQDGVGSLAFGTAAVDALTWLTDRLGPSDSTTGWYQDGCDGHDWYKARWDGFSAVFTDRDGTRQFDGWEVNDLSDLPPHLLIAGGIHAGTKWSYLDGTLGADFFDDYLGERWRIPALGYTNGRFAGPVSDPPAGNSAIASFGTGTGGFESC